MAAAIICASPTKRNSTPPADNPRSLGQPRYRQRLPYHLWQKLHPVLLAGHLRWQVRFYPHGSGSYVDGSASIPTGVWTHVAVTYDGTTRRYYINGALDLTSSLYPGALTTSTTDLAIGADLNPLSLYEWYGTIDEVRLWTRALTQTEIQSNLYGSRTVGGAGSGLVGYWRLDGNTYDYSYNFGSANNSGVLQDNATYTNTGVEPDDIAFTQQAGRTFTMDGSASRRIRRGLRIPHRLF